MAFIKSKFCSCVLRASLNGCSCVGISFVSRCLANGNVSVLQEFYIIKTGIWCGVGTIFLSNYISVCLGGGGKDRILISHFLFVEGKILNSMFFFYFMSEVPSAACTFKRDYKKIKESSAILGVLILNFGFGHFPTTLTQIIYVFPTYIVIVIFSDEISSLEPRLHELKCIRLAARSYPFAAEISRGSRKFYSYIFFTFELLACGILFLFLVFLSTNIFCYTAVSS